jgi:hypothetical protein
MNGTADVLAIMICILLIVVVFIPPMGYVKDSTQKYKLNKNIQSSDFENLQGEYIVVETLRYSLSPDSLNAIDNAGFELVAQNSKEVLTISATEYIFHRKPGNIE